MSSSKNPHSAAASGNSAAPKQACRAVITAFMKDISNLPEDERESDNTLRDLHDQLRASTNWKAQKDGFRVNNELRPLLRMLKLGNEDLITNGNRDQLIATLDAALLGVSKGPSPRKDKGGAQGRSPGKGPRTPSPQKGKAPHRQQEPEVQVVNVAAGKTGQDDRLDRLEARMDAFMTQVMSKFDQHQERNTVTTGGNGVSDTSIQQKISDRQRQCNGDTTASKRKTPALSKTTSIISDVRTAHQTVDEETVFDDEVGVLPPPHLQHNRGKVRLQLEEDELHEGFAFYQQTINMYDGSMSAWARNTRWRQTRNAREAVTMARLVDMAAGQGINIEAWGFAELALRRLVALHVADQDGNWNVARAYEEPGCQLGVVIPVKLSKRALKAANLRHRLKKGPTNKGQADSDEE